jgi:hypothetical protein
MLHECRHCRWALIFIPVREPDAILTMYCGPIVSNSTFGVAAHLTSLRFHEAGKSSAKRIETAVTRILSLYGHTHAIFSISVLLSSIIFWSPGSVLYLAQDTVGFRGEQKYFV